MLLFAWNARFSGADTPCRRARNGGATAVLPPTLPRAPSPIHSTGAPDPWVVFHDGWYYLCQSDNRSISVYKSRSFIERGERKVVWRAPDSGWNRARIWAPELHFVRGKWYIYYAASRARMDFIAWGFSKQ